MSTSRLVHTIIYIEIDTAPHDEIVTSCLSMLHFVDIARK